jgi:hypothetical protein
MIWIFRCECISRIGLRIFYQHFSGTKCQAPLASESFAYFGNFGNFGNCGNFGNFGNNGNNGNQWKY